MILGVGIDIVDIPRFERMIERGDNLFFEEIFTGGEIERTGKQPDIAKAYARGFALKEAFMKALGWGLSEGFIWKNIEILETSRSRHKNISYNITGRVRNRLDELAVNDISLSFSNCGNFSVAIAILEKN